MKNFTFFLCLFFIKNFNAQDFPSSKGNFDDFGKLGFENGEIISSKNGKINWESELYRSNKISDSYMVGVYFSSSSPHRENSIVTEGIVLVKTTNSNSIRKGDIITSGTNGRAIHFNGKGWALGVAIEDESNGFVLTRLYIHYKD
jgi:hypothetical protein